MVAEAGIAESAAGAEVNASTCQILVGGRIILEAKNLSYDGKSLFMRGLALKGSVGEIEFPHLEQAMRDYTQNGNSKDLEIRLFLV